MDMIEVVLAGFGGLTPQMVKAMREKMINATELEKKGTKIVLPEDMSLKQAIETLQKKEQDDETEVALVEVIEAYPYDAAHALMLVLEDRFGYVGVEPGEFETFFGDVKVPPMYRNVEIAKGVYRQILWSGIKLPGVDGTFQCKFHRRDNRTIFALAATIKGKYRKIFQEFAQAIRDKLKTHSIYKGKAIKVSFRDDSDGEEMTEKIPEFMHVEDAIEPIFTKETSSHLELSILNTIRHTVSMRKHGIPLKRTVLLEGGYGTGKTLFATQIANECIENNWTFIYVDDARDLEKALSLAEQYTPSVVFAEDSDLVMSGDRNIEMNKLSCVLDGVDNKTREVLLVLTTNNVEDFEQLMLRPGRIDSIITIQKPDADAVWRLLKHYAKDTLQGDPKHFERAIEPMVGQNAAFIAEVVKQAKLHAVGREESQLYLTPKDIEVAVSLMKNHVAIMNSPQDDDDDEEIPMKDLMVRLSRNGAEAVEVE